MSYLRLLKKRVTLVMWIDIIVIQWTLEVASILIIVRGSHVTAPDVVNQQDSFL